MAKAKFLLDVPWKAQQGQRLCWAAVIESLLFFFPSADSKTQEEISAIIFGVPTDKFFSAKEGLESFGLLREMVMRPLSPSEISLELAAQYPVLARQKIFVGGHLILITGMSVKNELHILDPIKGEFWVDYYDFRDHYEGLHQWERSYLLKAPTKINNGRI